jgi:hypothetical protein
MPTPFHSSGRDPPGRRAGLLTPSTAPSPLLSPWLNLTTDARCHPRFPANTVTTNP